MSRPLIAGTPPSGLGARLHVQFKKSRKSKADGSMVTVKLDADFKVTSTEAGMR